MELYGLGIWEWLKKFVGWEELNHVFLETLEMLD